MPAIVVPPEIEAVFREFRTGEFSTLARDGTPVTWPTLPFWEPEHGRFLITSSPGLPAKVFNVRRTPRVALLFSDPTASGLTAPPAVLVQGNAESPDQVTTSIAGAEHILRQVFQRQPASGLYSSYPLLRRLFDFYYMRIAIYVYPQRVLAWPHGDFSQAPQEVVVRHVG